MDIETSVLHRYSEAARNRQDALCCPVSYEADLLRQLPAEIVEKDYGCGDPSRYVRAGDRVLDLGSGSGKICYIAAQLVGETGTVVGVDMNDDMLALARKYQAEMATVLGGDRVRFLKGWIHDLKLDLAAVDGYLAQRPVSTAADLVPLRQWQELQKAKQPLIPDSSVDLVISNCVLNLVADADKAQLVREIWRVLKPGGRIAISDIVSDEPVPEALKDDAELWSGCIAGAFHEQEFLQAFAEAGFLAVALDKWGEEPWQRVEGIEFRAVTVTAVKGSLEPCIDKGHAVIYRGPFAEVRDDENHVYPRGERVAVCERTYQFLTQGPLRHVFIGIEPGNEVPPRPWCEPSGTRRPAAANRGARHAAGEGGSCC